MIVAMRSRCPLVLRPHEFAIIHPTSCMRSSLSVSLSTVTPFLGPSGAPSVVLADNKQRLWHMFPLWSVTLVCDALAGTNPILSPSLPFSRKRGSRVVSTPLLITAAYLQHNRRRTTRQPKELEMEEDEHAQTEDVCFVFLENTHPPTTSQGRPKDQVL